jgi:hypothetical protein
MGTTPTPPVVGPNPIDLCTVADVLGWLNANSPPAPTQPTDTDQIQQIITAWSSMFMWRTGRGDMAEDTPTESPFNSWVNYQEAYDGNGSMKLYLRNYPIQAVNVLQVGNTIIPVSPKFGVSGYNVSVSKRYLFIRGAGGTSMSGTVFGTWFVNGFTKGIQNILVDYIAGYDPVPYDILVACIKSSALEYKKRSYIGVASKAMAQGAGSITYLSPAPSGDNGGFEYDPDVERLIENYTRPWLTV